MFDIQLKPHEQEISIPELIDRIVNSRNTRMAEPTSSSDAIRQFLIRDAESYKFKAVVQTAIDEAISKGFLRVTSLYEKERIKIDALVEWTYRCNRKVMQLGIGGRESYADAYMTEMLKQAKPVGMGRKAMPKPIQRWEAQDAAILAEIKNLGYDPLKLPKPAAGKGGVKAIVRKTMTTTNKETFLSARVFDDAWQRLRNNECICDE